MGLQLVAGPLTEPVIVDEIKNHLYVTDDSNDELLTNYGLAARQVMESFRYPGLGGTVMITQTWKLILDKFPDSGLEFIEIPMAPVQAGTVSITYTDINNNVTTMDPATYVVDIFPMLGQGAGPSRILPIQVGSFFGSWPAPTAGLLPINAVAITFKAGFGDTPDTVPMQLKIPLLMLTGTLFENREATGDGSNVSAPPKVPTMMPFTYDYLTGLYRMAGIA